MTSLILDELWNYPDKAKNQSTQKIKAIFHDYVHSSEEQR